MAGIIHATSIQDHARNRRWMCHPWTQCGGAAHRYTGQQRTDRADSVNDIVLENLARLQAAVKEPTLSVSGCNIAEGNILLQSTLHNEQWGVSG